MSIFLSLEAVVCIMFILFSNVCCKCMWVWTLDVWGELACHKRSLTHCPSSQGLASSVLLLCVCMLVCLDEVGCIFFLSSML